jgi:N-acetyl sugar amidotransferase
MQPLPFPPFESTPIDVAARYTLPTDIRYCARCVISNQRPRIQLDDEGVCSACRWAEVKRNEIDWKKRDSELVALCDKHRRNDGRFDVIVPCSGGKDSGYVAHVLKTELGMHPLTVTWAPHWYTEIGIQNLDALIHAGFDNLKFTPNGAVHRLMTRLATIHLGDPFQPFIYGQKNFPISMATKLDIPLIMYGENGEVEYGGDMKNAYSPTHNITDDLVKHYFSGISPEDWIEHGVEKHDLAVYTGPPREHIERTGVECHFMGYYRKWVPQELFYYCSENTGFKANPEGRSEGTYSKYASLDDRLDGFHYYFAFMKFGIGRCTSDAAHEVRDGHLQREEAVALVKRFDGEFPAKHFDEFLAYTGLSADEFHRVTDAWRGKTAWTKDGKTWKLRKPVWEAT